MRRLLMLSVAFALAGPACDSKDAKDGESKKADVKRPDEPTDGSKLAVEVLGHEKDHAKVRIFNFSDKAVTQLSLRQEFLDEGGKVLGKFPHMVIGTPNVVEAKGTVDTETVLMSVPDGMKSIRVTVKKLEREGGDKWEKKADAPAQ